MKKVIKKKALPVVYEVSVRNYSKEGTIQAVTDDLERIASLGIDVIWLMPIYENKKKNVTKENATGCEIGVFDADKNILYYYWQSI